MSALSTEPYTRLHITRRGRAVVASLLALPLIAAAAVLLPAGLAAAGTGDAGVSFQRVTVTDGESLWSIAERVAPHADPRDVVHDISSLNALDGSVVTPGQSLAIPTRYAHQG